jgi:hypothetical protein
MRRRTLREYLCTPNPDLTVLHGFSDASRKCLLVSAGCYSTVYYFAVTKSLALSRRLCLLNNNTCQATPTTFCRHHKAVASAGRRLS